MKCPKCGFTNNRPGTRCLKCGSPFMETPTAIQEPGPQPKQPTIPDWRKEVTRKAREYGERKKFLTTPPRPLKEEKSDTPIEYSAETLPPIVEIPVRIEPELPKLHPKESPSLAVREPLPINPLPPLSGGPQPHHRLEFELMNLPDPNLESDEDVDDEPTYFMRRAASFLVDHAIVAVLFFVIAFVCRELFSYDLKILYQTTPAQLISSALLFHFLYYLYFYKTARQTPGQVFFSLEVREPYSSGIATGKIFVRWASLMLLNVLNVLPLFFGKKFMLLDLLSGTEIRSFKKK